MVCKFIQPIIESKKKKKKVAFQEEKHIVVTRSNRGKSNYLTLIYGLHFFGISTYKETDRNKS